VKGEPLVSAATDAWLARPDVGVGFVSANAAAAVDFYGEVLGFTTEGAAVSDARGIVQAMRAGGNRVEIRELSAPPPSAAGGIYDAFGLRVLGVLVDDLDGVIDRIRARGRRVADARDLPGRLRITFAKDADGNMLELIGLPEPAGPELTSRLQIGLTVSDVEAARAFYGGVLGLPEQPPVPIQAGILRYAFSAGRSTIKLWRPPETKRSHAGPPEAAIGIRAIHFAVDDPESLRDVVESRGARLTAMEGGLPGFYAIDPDGNRLRFAPPH